MSQVAVRVVAAAVLTLALAGGSPQVPKAVAHLAAGRVVSVTIDAGEGRVVSSPAGIDCPSTCSASFDTGTPVTLTASPGTGYRIDRWPVPAGCSADAPCVVAASGSAQPAAVVFRPAATLQLVPNGPGAIAVSPAGVDLDTGASRDRCDEAEAVTCLLAYLPGTEISALAQPAAGSTFASFSDFRCSQAACRLTLETGERSLVASFGPLELRVRANGDGRVVSEPGGIDCGDSCSGSYAVGQQVVLSAVGGAPEWVFGCTPENGDVHATRCTVVVSADPTVVGIRFGDADKPGVPGRVEVELSVAVSGEGRVLGDKIDCGSRCEARYGFGDRERLRAEAASGYRFARWDGGCGADAQCEFPVGPVTSVQAIFERPEATTTTTPTTPTTTTTPKPKPRPNALRLRLLGVEMTGHAAKRKVRVVVSLSRRARLTGRLETRSHRLVVRRSRLARAGRRVILLPVPRRTGPGRYVAVAVAADRGSTVRVGRTVRIGR